MKLTEYENKKFDNILTGFLEFITTSRYLLCDRCRKNLADNVFYKMEKEK